ncbi:MAG: DUF3052 domain-containing protein [Chloroflexi bacterium]|nr:DUF3052 domain-containing protein [Chloroflexota bacterium]
MSTWRVESEAERRARYAAKDVTEKLGIKPGQRVRAVGNGDDELLRKVRAKTGAPLVRADLPADLVLYFPTSADEITPTLRHLKEQIALDGGIWVVSAKKGQGGLYLPDTQLIPLGLAAGLVDNKICSVSARQSAMRFVIRRAERRGKQ